MKFEEFIFDLKLRELIEIVREFVKSFFDREGMYGFSYVERVFNFCMYIGKEEGVDLEVFVLVVFFYDIVCLLEDLGKVEDYVFEGVRIVRRYLRSFGYFEDKVEVVVYVIEVYCFLCGFELVIFEVKILSDVDKFDVIGVVGIVRVFMYLGEYGRGIDVLIKYFEEKILKLKDLMYIEIVRKMVEERYCFIEEFIEWFRCEIEGEI